MTAGPDGNRVCSLCARRLAASDPTYPVRFDDAPADVEVCVACAAHLAREGIGAWPRGSGPGARG